MHAFVFVSLFVYFYVVMETRPILTLDEFVLYVWKINVNDNTCWEFPRAAMAQWVYNFVSATSEFNTSNTPHYIQNNTSITSADPDRNNNMCVQIIEISLLFWGC